MGCAEFQNRLLPSVLLSLLLDRSSPHTRGSDVEASRVATDRAHVLRLGVAHLPLVGVGDELQECVFGVLPVHGSLQARASGTESNRMTVDMAHVLGIFAAYLPCVGAGEELQGRGLEALVWLASLLDRSRFGVSVRGSLTSSPP